MHFYYKETRKHYYYCKGIYFFSAERLIELSVSPKTVYSIRLLFTVPLPPLFPHIDYRGEGLDWHHRNVPVIHSVFTRGVRWTPSLKVYIRQETGGSVLPMA